MTGVLALLGGLDRVVVGLVVVQVLGEGSGYGCFLEAGGVGRGLSAELGEVEVRARAVADVHGFVEATLREDAVGDDAVDGDGDDFDDDFDEGADETPVLWRVSWLGLQGGWSG